jgi:archaemetzincin
VRKALVRAVLIVCAAVGIACSPLAATQAAPSLGELRAMMIKLAPLNQKLGPPKSGDWLSLHEEEGQTFKEYLDYDPALPRGRRSVLYIQTLGGFTPDQRRIVNLTTEFIGLYFNLPVRTLENLPLTVFPPRAQRILPESGGQQILTSYILKKVLKPRLPQDGAAVVGLTATDLWPREGWNFVFGQASLSERVGVWSISRYGNPSESEAAFRLCLLRAIATATHETGHMFSLLHCTRFECNMNGSESLEESDRQPLALCPECLAKICWATRTQPLEHLKRLADFCRKTGLKKEEAAYRRSIKVLETKLH